MRETKYIYIHENVPKILFTLEEATRLIENGILAF